MAGFGGRRLSCLPARNSRRIHLYLRFKSRSSQHPVFPHSRVCRSFCFALLCESLSFAWPKESNQRKKTPDLRAGAKRAGALRCSVRRDTARTRIALAILKQLAAPAQCAGHPSALRFSSRQTGPEYSAAYPATELEQLPRRNCGVWLRSGRTRLRHRRPKIAWRSWQSVSEPVFVCMRSPWA